jgi:hypothetical protein
MAYLLDQAEATARSIEINACEDGDPLDDAVARVWINHLDVISSVLSRASKAQRRPFPITITIAGCVQSVAYTITYHPSPRNDTHNHCRTEQTEWITPAGWSTDRAKSSFEAHHLGVTVLSCEPIDDI